MRGWRRGKRSFPRSTTRGWRSIEAHGLVSRASICFPFSRSRLREHGISKFVTAAVAQAKAAAQHTPIDIGIGINPHNPPTVITAAMIREAYDIGVSAGAAGFWHNIESHVNADVPLTVYVEFFHQLYREETGGGR